MTAEIIGKTLSHYRVKSKLGSGGMGVVYEAEDTTLGRSVALKFLPAEMAQDANLLERFQREARAASALNHPAICTVYAIDQHEGQHFIAMELLEGETLAERIRRGAFDVPRLLDVGIQLADALESAHAKGIVHRDVKPANIFINTRGQAKILDFGLAKIDRGLTGNINHQTGGPTVSRDELTRAGTAVGTVSYMSPEQARAQLTDARTDIFSLGAVLYQMATGTLPFQGDTSAVIFDNILNHDPAPASQINPALPAELTRIIGNALEKDRALRYQSATDLKTDLLRLKRDLDSGSRRASDSSESRKAASTLKSIAVLYFENLSGVKEDEYLRDGITEDLVTELSKIKGLQIFSRATVLAYRDKPVTPATIGQQLNAAYALTGSLRRAGARLRINAQLVDTHTDFPLWSERYDREMKDVFEVQDEIARKHRRGAAHHVDAAGAGGAGGEADRESAGIRSLPARTQLCAPPDAAGPRVRAADVRERGVTRSALRAGVRRHRQHVRAVSQSVRARRQMDRPRHGRERARQRPRQGRAGGARRRSVGPLHEGAIRAVGAARAAGHRQKAGRRKRVLPARPGVVRRRPLSGSRRHG